MKVELKVECKNYSPVETRFVIYVNTISAYINGGEFGTVFSFPKRLRKVVDWSWPG